MNKIPTTIMTGFLGAGKTTLIRALLESRQLTRFALIINEFGELGMDGEILRGCGVMGSDDADLVELANGCICCTVAEEFQPAMETLLARHPPPDHIIIETSGLALPQPLVSAFNWPGIAGRVTVDAVVTVVDGPAVIEGRFADDPEAVRAQGQADASLDHRTHLAELFADQLVCADLVVINKTEAINAGDLTALETELAATTRSGVTILTTRSGTLDPRVLLGLDLAAETRLDERHALHHHHHDEAGEEAHGHDAFDSVSCVLPEIVDSGAFRRRLEDAIATHRLLRLKGFVAIRGKPMRYVVQAAGPRLETYYDRPFTSNEARQGRLVAIGPIGLDRAALRAAFAA